MRKGIFITALILGMALIVGCTSSTNEPDTNNNLPMENPVETNKEDEKVEVVQPKTDKEEEIVEEKKEVDMIKLEPAKEVVVEPSKDNNDNGLELPQLPELTDLSTEGLSNELMGWSWRRNSEHKQPEAYADTEMLAKYSGYYIQPTDEKVIYLTFDNGYENGFTPQILDTLKKHDVKATFFVTLPYIRDNKELVIRMKEEGHIVGNHTVKHESMPSLSDEEVISEIQGVADYMIETTGYSIDSYFRPPRGEFSERTLYLTSEMGYKTIFWSMAYVDWKRDDQPGKEYALSHVMENYHPGSIPLLHSVSSSNAEALEDMIINLKNEGYRFGDLSELE